MRHALAAVLLLFACGWLRAEEAPAFAVHDKLGDSRRSEWRLDEARREYIAALEAVPTPAPAGFRAEVARKIAEVESLSGRAAEALAWNEKASQWAEQEPGDSLVPIRIVLQRAMLLFDAGRDRDAEALRAQALRMAGSNAEHRTLVLIEIASGRLFQGDYAGAISLFNDVIEFLQQSKRSGEEMYAWSVVAMIYLIIGDADSADATIERSAVLAEHSSIPFAKRAIAATTMARRYVTGEASPLQFLAAWEEFMKLSGVGSPSDETAMKNALDPDFDPQQILPFRGISNVLRAVEGLRLLNDGQAAEGRQILLEVLEKVTNLDFRSFLLSMVGGSYILERKLDDATRYYSEAVNALELEARELRGEEMLIKFYDKIEDRELTYGILINLLTAQGCNEQAMEYAERARSRALLQMIGNRRINPRQERLAAEIESLRRSIHSLEQQARLGIALERKTAAAELSSARRRFSELLVRAEASNSEYSQMVTVHSLDLAGIRKELPPKTTLINYFITPGMLRAWIVDEKRLEYVSRKVGAEDLQRIVCWASALRSGGTARGMASPDQKCADETRSEDVYKLVVEPLRAKIRHRRLIIVPHGVLHYVPFAALRNPATGRYLVEDFTITYVPSISILRWLRAKESPVDGKALIIGNPVNPAGGLRLSGARKEAIRIARQFRTRAKLGAAATEGLLHDLRGRFDLVHIGAHGEYDADHPLFSRIVLAPDASHDGLFEVHEILGGVDFSGVNLVVLSACGSGRGTPTAGDEIVGLTRAIHYAGSPGVISTLWDIDDDATAELMKEFYARLRKGVSAADALRQAQIALLRHAPYRDPSSWAAFFLSGNPHGRWGVNARDRRRRDRSSRSLSAPR